MLIQVAAAKVGKWGTSESGDTLEMIERPHGGISLVLADGQSSGRAAKAISNLVARKALAELAEGVRDGAAARAANDYLYTHRAGKVSATLNIISVDLVSKTLVLTRNSPCPFVARLPTGEIRVLAAPSEPIGVHRGTRPSIAELPLAVGTIVLSYTDGLELAGARASPVLNVPAVLEHLLAQGCQDAPCLADRLLAHALALDEGRPRDDISVVVLCVVDQDSDGARRLSVHLPI